MRFFKKNGTSLELFEEQAVNLQCYLTKNTLLDIDLFGFDYSFRSGIKFINLLIDADWYKAHHNPAFEVTFSVFNFLIFHICIRNANHLEDDDCSYVCTEKCNCGTTVSIYYDSEKDSNLSSSIVCPVCQKDIIIKKREM